MEKKTLTIIIVAVVAVAIIVGVVVALSMNNNSNDDNKYVTYEGNGGTTSPSGDTSYKCYSETVDETRFFMDNYQLTSFNDKANGTGKVYHTGDHVDYGTTLYAQWAKITNTNVKISTNSGSLSFITIKNGSDILSVGDNVLTNENCKFTVTLEPQYGYTLSEEGSTSFYQYFLKDSMDNTVCTIKLAYTGYSVKGSSLFNVSYNANGLVVSMEYIKELSVTLTYTQ